MGIGVAFDGITELADGINNVFDNLVQVLPVQVLQRDVYQRVKKMKEIK